MAFIDYGAVVFKNGKFINRNEFFQDMLTEVGWEDWKNIRYEGCTFLDKDTGCSNCYECPYANYIHHNDPELGEWDTFVSDCKGNVIEKNRIKNNYFAYIGDEDLTIGFYKYWFVIYTNKKEFNYAFSLKKKAYTFNINGAHIHMKSLDDANRVWKCEMSYKGNKYTIVYGYGIDSNIETWNSVKYKYLDKKLANKVDRIYKKFGIN